MKWVKINNMHINTDAVRAFKWMSGMLYIWYTFAPSPVGYDDSDGVNYSRLCRVLGVQPREEDTDQ